MTSSSEAHFRPGIRLPGVIDDTKPVGKLGSSRHFLNNPNSCQSLFKSSHLARPGKGEMMSERKYVGIDVDKINLEVAFDPEQPKKSFPNDKGGFKTLIKLFQESAVDHVVMEATGGFEVAGIGG